MKRVKKRMPIPQKEFGFTPNTFNLIQEWTNDGEQVVREREEIQKQKECAKTAQSALFRIE